MLIGEWLRFGVAIGPKINAKHVIRPGLPLDVDNARGVIALAGGHDERIEGGEHRPDGGRQALVAAGLVAR